MNDTSIRLPRLVPEILPPTELPILYHTFTSKQLDFDTGDKLSVGGYWYHLIGEYRWSQFRRKFQENNYCPYNIVQHSKIVDGSGKVPVRMLQLRTQSSEININRIYLTETNDIISNKVGQVFAIIDFTSRGLEILEHLPQEYGVQWEQMDYQPIISDHSNILQL